MHVITCVPDCIASALGEPCTNVLSGLPGSGDTRAQRGFSAGRLIGTQRCGRVDKSFEMRKEIVQLARYPGHHRVVGRTVGARPDSQATQPRRAWDSPFIAGPLGRPFGRVVAARVRTLAHTAVRCLGAAAETGSARTVPGDASKVTQAGQCFVCCDAQIHEHATGNLVATTPLYPLKFEPNYRYRPWGGRRLSNRFASPLPDDGPIGEAWLLSDRDDYSSCVADGILKGMTIGQLLKRSPEQVLGKLAARFDRFPLLLKFLDVKTKLSVQVHPSDAHRDLIPPGDTGKTEAWVVLAKGPEARIYAGLTRATTSSILRQAIASGSVPDQLASFAPRLGDAVLLRAGAVHSMSDVVVFEAQENSDVTFRLYDWDHVDPKTGQRRTLQVDRAMACVDFTQGPISPVASLVEESRPVLREKLVGCEYFQISRISGRVPFVVGAAGAPRVLVCLAGNGQLERVGDRYAFGKGDALLLPAVVGACSCLPHQAVSLLEISLPEGP